MGDGTNVNHDKHTAGDVFYDDRRNKHLLVVRTDADGLTLREANIEYYIPHSLFATWYDSWLLDADEVNIDAPEWVATITERD